MVYLSEFVNIFLALFIYDIVGYVYVKKITGAHSFYSMPIGFLIIVTLFHLLTLPIMLLKLSFSIVLYPITLILLLFILYCIYKAIFKMRYLKYLAIKVTSSQFHLACLCSILYGLFIILFASDADQYLYQKMVQTTLDSNIVYNMIKDSHELNSVYLYNALLIKLFQTNIFSFTYGAYRFIEAFFYIFLLFLYNQFAFKNKLITVLMLVVGMFGFQTFAISLFNPGFKLTQLFGNSGTYVLMYAFPFVYSLNLFIKKPNNKYMLFLIFIAPFAFTTTLYPFVLYFMLVYYYILGGDEKNFLIIFLIYLYNMLFYLILMKIPLIIAVVFIMLVSIVVLMRLAWISQSKSELKNFYKYLLIFHMLGFLVLCGMSVYLTSSKIFLVLALLVYYKRYKMDNVLKYSLFIAFIYLALFNNYSETNLLVMARRIVSFVPINIYYQAMLLNKRIVKFLLCMSIVAICYLFNQQPMAYAPVAQLKKQKQVYVPYYPVENMYDYGFVPTDKVYQQTFNPRVYNLGTFIFSTNPKQCPSKDEKCVCQPGDDCFLILQRYQQNMTYNYLFDDYNDIISLQEYYIIRKTNDQAEIESWITSQLRE